MRPNAADVWVTWTLGLGLGFGLHDGDEVAEESPIANRSNYYWKPLGHRNEPARAGPRTRW
jgi:hypothetical protein